MGLTDILESWHQQTFQSCVTDIYSSIAGLTDLPELRDRQIFYSCRTDGQSRVVGLMNLSELQTDRHSRATELMDIPKLLV